MKPIDKKLILPYLLNALIISFIPLQTSGEQLFRKHSTPVETWDTIHVDYEASGISIDIIFQKGSAHNHPLMALWLEDMTGNYIQTLFVAESIGK